MNRAAASLSALVGKGYFPSELPPNFTTADFGRHVVEILDEWKNSGVFKRQTITRKSQKGKLRKRNAYSYIVSSTDSEFISKPKRGFERRNIHITHPVAQALLSYEITYNWKSVLKWILRQKYTLDKIKIDAKYSRAVSGIDFSLHQAKKEFIESCSDWIVRTDITRFYPSIYTHSIPWAAYGKSNVKSDLKKYEGSVADRLDQLVRACNRNQTIGIPIGPETSRIIAEIVSSRIDSDLDKLLNIKESDADRFQDDWFVGAGALDDAEKILSGITQVYRAYGLEINGSKTTVERMIDSRGSEWLGELRGFLSHKPGPLSGSRLQEFLRLSLRLQVHFKNELIVNYALVVLERNLNRDINVQIVESFLIKAALISPISMDKICRIILNLKFKTKDISAKRIEERFSVLAKRCVTNDHLFELMWILYTFRGLRVKIRNRDISQKFELTTSSSISLLLLDMERLGLCPHKLPKSEWARQADPDSVLNSSSWLLAYEGIRHGWLTDPHHLMRKPFFRAMSNHGVIFYDETRNVERSEKIVSKISRREKMSRKNVARLLARLRGVTEY